MTRIMFFGDLAGTGFGTVTIDLGRALMAGGDDLRFVSQNEFGEDIPADFADRTYSVNDPNGWLALRDKGIAGLLDGTLWEDGWTPDAAIILGDYFAVRGAVLADEETRMAFASVPTYHYIPVEGVDLPPAWAELWSIVHPVAMTEFGANEIEKISGVRPPVVYHGVNTTDFWPVSPERPIYLETASGTKKLRHKADCKRFFQSPTDSTWIFRADRHMPRKLYNSWIRSMVPVVSQRANTYAVFHCKTDDQGGNLLDTLSKYPDPIRKRFVSTRWHDIGGGAPREILNALYNAADLYVSCSAEGFGLTIAEAMACGVPAIGLDYSSVPEVIGPGGKLCPVGHLLDNEYDHFWATPNEPALARLTFDLLESPDELRSLGRAAARHVRESFTWSNAARQFSEIVAAMPQKVAA